MYMTKILVGLVRCLVVLYESNPELEKERAHGTLASREMCLAAAGVAGCLCNPPPPL